MLEQKQPTKYKKPKEQAEPQPIGENRWGKVYQWTLGRAKEAAAFLKKQGSGYLKGVFHREGIGDIDVVWGNEKAGLQKIEQKHTVELNDFESLEQAMPIIDDVIKSGEMHEENDSIVIEKGDYRVILRKSEDGTWVLSAYDYVRKESEKRRDNADSEKVLGQNTENGSSPLYNDSDNSSADKGTKNNSDGKTESHIVLLKQKKHFP